MRRIFGSLAVIVVRVVLWVCSIFHILTLYFIQRTDYKRILWNIFRKDKILVYNLTFHYTIWREKMSSFWCMHSCFLAYLLIRLIEKLVCVVTEHTFFRNTYLCVYMHSVLHVHSCQKKNRNQKHKLFFASNT